MTVFDWLKLVHVSCAVLSIAGFAVRGAWAISDHPWRRHPVTRTLPHLVDTLLLGSAIGMLIVWGVSPLAADWLIAKIVALLVYIALGMMVMRFAHRRPLQLLAYAGALATATYIVAVACTHSPRGFLSLAGL